MTATKTKNHPLLVTTTPIAGHIRYRPWLGWCWLMALIPPLHSYPMWTLAGMVLAHGPHDPTTAFVSDMAALARPKQGVIHHAHTFSYNGYGPGIKAIVEHMCMLNDAWSRPGQGCQI